MTFSKICIYLCTCLIDRFTFSCYNVSNFLTFRMENKNRNTMHANTFINQTTFNNLIVKDAFPLTLLYLLAMIISLEESIISYKLS